MQGTVSYAALCDSGIEPDKPTLPSKGNAYWMWNAMLIVVLSMISQRHLLLATFPVYLRTRLYSSDQRHVNVIDGIATDGG